MPISAVHMCLEYLINSTDVALCLQREGWREGGKEGGRVNDKKEEQRVQTEKQWMR